MLVKVIIFLYSSTESLQNPWDFIFDFFLLLSPFFKLLLGFKDAQEYWEELLQKNMYPFFFFAF